MLFTYTFESLPYANNKEADPGADQSVCSWVQVDHQKIKIDLSSIIHDWSTQPL